ncbi:MAG: flagellin [Firmicutes bacterium HGW-Firmicutes-14]|nr:MAG: flagellin [Firmicutes bacterium HGW-Firmicutes-14]
MRIQNNIEALNAWRNLYTSNTNLGKSLEKLSSGFRINRAADDAAGLAISEKMRSQIKGLNRAIQNAQDGISLLQTAEGALNETHSILQRMRELAVQASNSTLTTEDRSKLNDEVTALKSEMDRIASNTEFNTLKLLDGSFSGTLHIGSNAAQTLTVAISSASSSDLGVNGVAVTDIANASSAIGLIDTAIESVSVSRANLGAMQNRLEHTIQNLGVAVENLTASESRIRDVDMAAEMMNFTKTQILMQAGTAMLAQANAKPQSILQLLG